MAELNPKTITEFPEVTTLDGTELLPMSQGGSTKKAAVATVTEKAVDEAVNGLLSGTKPMFKIVNTIQGPTSASGETTHSGSFKIKNYLPNGVQASDIEGYRAFALAGYSTGNGAAGIIRMAIFVDNDGDDCIGFNVRLFATSSSTMTPIVDVVFIRDVSRDTNSGGGST